MERMTRWNHETEEAECEIDGVVHTGSITTRLAEYEDTGLEPEQCAKYAQAEKEGRLVVLPRKVGDTVFSAFENEGVFCGKVYAISMCDGTNWFSVRYDGGLRYYHTWDEIGKTVFFAREDAEKALEGMK